jgi:hypothetical protein
MRFDPLIHTKEFLLSNPEVALSLAKDSEEFSKSSIANDFSVLCLADASGNTVAHLLAENHSDWLQSDAVKSSEVLFLANNGGWTVAHWLAKFQPEWLFSEASRSPEILSLADEHGVTVAHRLAQHQPEWLFSDASRLPEILRLADEHGLTVAHWLAQRQPKWLRSGSSKSYDILKLADKNGYTVAHWLAQFQPEWLRSEASKTHEVLRMAANSGITVAFGILNHEQCLMHGMLFQKEILALEHYDAILAEKITEKYSLSHGMNIPSIAMKLISQGAAYKHSVPMTVNVGHELIKQTQSLIDEYIQPLAALKQLQALFSTCARAVVSADNVPTIIISGETHHLGEWQDIKIQSENMIRQHLNAYPELYDIEHTVDIFCEPADDLLKKLQTERILSVEMGGLESSIASNDVEPIKQAIY